MERWFTLRAPYTVLALTLLALLAPVAPAQPLPEQPPEGAIVAPTGNSAQDVRATLEMSAATWYNDRDGDKIFDTLEQRFDGAPGITQRTIVTFVEGTNVSQAVAEIDSLIENFAPRYIYHHFGGLAADLNRDDAYVLAGLSNVRQIEFSQAGLPELDSATQTMGVRAVQDLLRPARQPPALPPGIDGSGGVIAIMDSGFDGHHVDLAGKFLRFIDWSDGGREVFPYDSSNHGTHVASIAAGLGIGDPAYTGVAPGADLVGFRIASNDTKAAAIASVDWILGHPEQGVRISTISYGFGPTVDGTDALELAMDQLWESGVVAFKSNGNGGPARQTVTIPGGARGILATGAIYDPGESGLRIYERSSRGPTADGRIKPDITAPGALIMAASEGTVNGYRNGTGTSMASPFAAGVAALMINADPNLAAADVRRILEQTAWDHGPPGPDIDWGAGRIDALRAVQQVLLERAIREHIPWPEVAAWNVTGPRHLGEAYDRLAGPAAEGSFEVLEAGHSMGLTIITDGIESEARYANTRAIAIVVKDPDGRYMVDEPITIIRRQQTHGFPAADAGPYEVWITGLDGPDGVDITAIGALPIDGNPWVLPGDADAYHAMGGPAGGAGPGSPGSGIGAASLAAVFLFLWRRPRP